MAIDQSPSSEKLAILVSGLKNIPDALKLKVKRFSLTWEERGSGFDPKVLVPVVDVQFHGDEIMYEVNHGPLA